MISKINLKNGKARNVVWGELSDERIMSNSEKFNMPVKCKMRRCTK